MDKEMEQKILIKQKKLIHIFVKCIMTSEVQ